MNEQSSAGDTEKRKLLDPTFHFTTNFLKIGDDSSTDKIPVTELVKGGQLLADFPNFHRFAAKGFAKSPIEPGDFAQLSEDEGAIVATVSGYPKVKKTRRSDVPEPITVVSIEPLLKVSPDNMLVTLVIHPPLETGHSLQQENLEELLADQKIIFGIDHQSIEDAKAFLKSGEKEFKSFIIARGQSVGQSIDAFLRYDMEIGPIAGTILENGSIDFRERRIMVGVKAGQCVATKIPAIQGAPGVNVYGQETAAKAGRDIKIDVLNDVQYSKETLQVTATKSGVLSIVNKNVIKVCSHQIILGDIDYETGNVESMNCITIRGSVQPGFRVTVAGDVEISGAVMSAKVISQGNLVVKGGITGKDSFLEIKGDADINFIEQGTIKCGGIAVIRKQSYYSDISAGSDIRCQKSSKIVGGRLIAEGNITIGDVGSINCTPSFIAAGVIAERLLHFNNLKASIVGQQDAIIQWLQRYHGSSTSKKVKAMEKELANTKLLLLRLNVIPGTGLYSKAGGPEDEKAQFSEDYSCAGSIEIEKIKIDVLGTIFSDTRIQIGNCTMVVEKTVSFRQFKLHPNKKSILAIAIKK
ncbi:MAG: FapA family protein [Proteobacteria bacterium]|nr:FapA family protein [Pseudomonadota bacterium]